MSWTTYLCEICAMPASKVYSDLFQWPGVDGFMEAAPCASHCRCADHPYSPRIMPLAANPFNGPFDRHQKACEICGRPAVAGSVKRFKWLGNDGIVRETVSVFHYLCDDHRRPSQEQWLGSDPFDCGDVNLAVAGGDNAQDAENARSPIA